MHKISDFELREIFRKKAIRKKINSVDAEDVAQEMFRIALHNEALRGISRFDQVMKWLFITACKNVFPKMQPRKQKDTQNVYIFLQGDTGEHSGEYKSFSDYDLGIWLDSVWEDTTTHSDGSSRPLRKYKCKANDKEFFMTANELKVLLRKEHLKIDDADFASNLKQRGKRIFLIDGALWHELQDACKHFECTFATIRKKHSVEEVKIRVL